MAKRTTRGALACLVFLLMVMVSTTAWADDEEQEPFRIVIMKIDDGGEEYIEEAISVVPDLDIRPYDWFVEQVEARAFRVDGITDSSSDLVWVMDGGDIDLVIDIQEESEAEFKVRFLIAEGAETEREFMADRSSDGSIRAGGAALIQLEFEDFMQVRPDFEAEARAAEEAAAEEAATVPDEAVDESDPEAMRQRAARDREELKERLKRDWLWVRAHGRFFQRDYSVAAQEAVFTYRSGGFFGLELDVEAFPMGWSNPDRYDTGFYATYNHGFYGVTLVDETGDEPQQEELSVHSVSIEGGALYRLDSPLNESNRQLRFKIGGRYENFSVTENAEIPSQAMVSLALGTRLVLPVLHEAFAVTAALDIVPGAIFLNGSEKFGSESFSYGFGSELGMLYEVMDNGFLSAGYTFRLMRTNFSGDGEPIGESEEPLVFSESEAFDLNQGVRAGFIYQY